MLLLIVGHRTIIMLLKNLNIRLKNISIFFIQKIKIQIILYTAVLVIKFKIFNNTICYEANQEMI